MNEKGKKNYYEFKNEKVIKIGVIGNSNKGKSFILSKISQIKLPSGTSIRTEGLSIKYPELEGYENRKIVLLDSAGLETPVLRDEEYYENKEKIKEYFKEKSREKLITELFLQNYIIYNSDILILVVGILTYSEQKLINRIIKEMKRNKIKKDLFIIHNLPTYTLVDQVKDYLNNYLLNSATFNLEEGHKISTIEKGEIKGKYYYEKTDEQKIFHLIFANEDSEAGNYYNKFTLKFIENTYQSVINTKPFDIIESVKERFIEVSKEIIENNGDKIELKDFENIDNNIDKIIKLNKNDKIILKRCLIDELGFSNLKNNGFEPTYNYYKKDDSIIIRVESPGNCSIKCKTIYSGEYTIIRIFGEKNNDIEPQKLEDNLFTNREFGPYYLDVPLKTEDYFIQKKKPSVEQKKGLSILTFKLDMNQESDELDIKKDEDV